MYLVCTSMYLGIPRGTQSRRLPSTPGPTYRPWPCLCLPHEGSQTGLGHGTEDRIGSEAKNLSVERKVVAAQDAVQNLPTGLVGFRNRLLKELDKRIPHITTVLGHGAFCEIECRESLFECATN